MPLSIVIPTLNEAAGIGAAIRELAWADDVIIIDGESTDDTRRIAEAAGARVIEVVGETIGAKRNAGISAARHTWVLALDADERVTPALLAEIRGIVGSPGAPNALAVRPAHAAYRMRFRNHYLGRELRHGPWGRDWHTRLFTRDRRFLTQRVHESLEPIDDVGILTGEIAHTPYRDLAHHVTKIVIYAKWGAHDLYARGRRANLWTMTARPAWRFVRDYVFLSGWRDGPPGLIAAVLSAFAAFLKYAFLFLEAGAGSA